MAELIAQLSPMAEHIFTTAGTVVDFITSNPLCLVSVSLMLAGAAVGFVRRLITVA